MRSLCRVSVHGAGLGGSLASLRLSPPREGLGAGHRQGDRQAARDGDQAWLRDYEAAAREVFAALPPERRPLRGRGDRHRRSRSGAAPPTPALRQHHPDLAAPLPPASDAAPQRAHRSGVPAPPRPSGPGRSQPPRPGRRQTRAAGPPPPPHRPAPSSRRRPAREPPAPRRRPPLPGPNSRPTAAISRSRPTSLTPEIYRLNSSHEPDTWP